jgi:hypothetical protein
MTCRGRRSGVSADTFSQIFAIGPQSRELQEQAAAWRKVVSRARQCGIGALQRASLSRILAPSWRMLVGRVNKLVPLHRIFVSTASLADSQLNLPGYSNYVALQKLAHGYWTHQERPLTSTVTLVDVRLNE